MMTCTTSRGRIKFHIRDAKRTICVGKGMCLVMSRGVKGADGVGSIQDLFDMLNATTAYDSDEAAKLGGVPFEGWYRTTVNHVTNRSSITPQMIP